MLTNLSSTDEILRTERMDDSDIPQYDVDTVIIESYELVTSGTGKVQVYTGTGTGTGTGTPNKSNSIRKAILIKKLMLHSLCVAFF